MKFSKPAHTDAESLEQELVVPDDGDFSSVLELIHSEGRANAVVLVGT